MIEKILTVSVNNKVQPIHWHDLLELDLILAGEVDVVRNNRTIHVPAGEIIVLNRDDVHSMSSDSEDLLYVQIQMNMEHYNQYIPEIWTYLFHCSPENTDLISQNLKAEIRSHVSRIVSLMQERGGNADAENRIIYCCIAILENLKMGFSAMNDTAQAPMNEEQAARIWKMIDYMYDHHDRRLTLHEVAEQVYISDDYASRLLKQQSGRSFEGFMAMIRSELSIRYLLNTDLSITGIAYECGFSAPRYYNAAFSEVYGCSPAEYRKRNKDNFILEKQKAAGRVLWDEGIDVGRVLRMLSEYEIYLGEGDDIRRSLDLDLADPEAGASGATGAAGASGVGAGAAASGTMQTDRIPEVKGRDFFAFEAQLALSEIPEGAGCPIKNAFFWQERDCWKLTIISSGDSDADYSIRFRGLKPGYSYIFCREKTPDLPPGLKKLLAKGRGGQVHRDLMQAAAKRTVEFGESSGEEILYMEFTLRPQQIARITIQQLPLSQTNPGRNV